MSMAPFYNGGREGENGTGGRGRAARRCARGAELGRVGGEKAAFAEGFWLWFRVGRIRGN